ncbi:MAG: toprim domain-containing protein [Candidatus Staskawiczbacteria bacterium]|nr:toprim domain-containing protein [Candidatus Staskawiczbacteria bacterium]
MCEGELDRLLLMSKGIPAITGTHGAGTFKDEWCKMLGFVRFLYVCFDNDEAGKKGAENALKRLAKVSNRTYLISLPEEIGSGGDITDYFIKLKGIPEDLFTNYAKEYPEKINTSLFKPLSSKELVDILGLTIKKDAENKLITFLCELSAYTENSQFNISFNAPSSTGKSYIPTETARLFPEEDVIEMGYCSTTAFFHDVGEYDKEKKGYLVDLSRKILIFLDQPHTQLLERLRPLLSHDKKEIVLKITDKSQKFGLKTKNVLLRGFPSVIFCSAGLKIDEQEGTRFLLLSPETSQEKIREAIYEKIKKETDNSAYKELLDNNPERKLLKDRILAIKQEDIKEIKIGSPEKIKERFLGKAKMLKPRHPRDIGRLISIIKSSALLNLWFRERSGSTIIANEEDIDEAFKIWDTISESQELNLPPFIFNLYKEVILPIWEEKVHDQNLGTVGITRQEIVQKNYRTNGRLMPDWQLRLHIIPMLENAGLIKQEADPNDKRKILIYPIATFNIQSLDKDKTIVSERVG